MPVDVTLTDAGRSTHRDPAGHRLAAAMPWCVSALGAAAVLWYAGTGLGDIARYGLHLGVGVVFPGCLVHRLLRTAPRTHAEDVAIGFALGSVVQLVAWWGLVTWAPGHAGLLLWLVPVLAAVSLLWGRVRSRVRQTRIEAMAPLWSWAITGVFAIVLAWLWGDFFRWFPLDPGRGTEYYTDLLWHLSVAAQLATTMPPDVPQVAGEPLQYHWFAMADLAAGSRASGVDLMVALFRLWVPSVLFFAVLAVSSLATRVSRHTWAGPLAACLLFVVGQVNVTTSRADQYPDTMQFYAWGSPTWTYSLVFLVPAAALSAEILRGLPAPHARGALAVVVLLALGLSGAKSTGLPVLFGGALVGLAVSAVTRRGRAVIVRHLVLAGLFLAGVGAASVVLFGGGNGALVIAPLSTARFLVTRLVPAAVAGPHLHLALAAAALGYWAFSVLGRLLGVLAMLRRPRSWDLAQVFWAGVLVSGAGAYFVTDHPGRSNVYFFLSGFPLGVMLSSWGLAAHWPPLRGSQVAMVLPGVGVIGLALFALLGHSQPRYDLLPATAAASLVLAAALWLPSRWRPATGLARPVALYAGVLFICAAGLPALFLRIGDQAVRPGVTLGIPDESTAPGAVPAKELEAFHWLRDHSRPDDIVATHRHCRESTATGVGSAGCRALAFSLSAFSERRVYLEGWAFAPRVSINLDPALVGRPPFWDPARLALNDEVFIHPTAQAANALCRQGVRWLVIDRRNAPQLPRLDSVATRRYTNADVEIYHLAPCR